MTKTQDQETQDQETRESETRDLPELLRGSYEVAPETIIPITNVAGKLVGFEIAKDHVPTPYGHTIRRRGDDTWELDFVDRAIIQVALQEAIENQGWSWSIYDDNSLEYVGAVYPSFPSKSDRTIYEADDPSTALALAFKHALRAENA